MLSRRELGVFAIAGAAAASRRKTSIALQLFSVRKQCAADLPGTLSRVAKLGIHGVEFAGYYGHEPREIRRLLAERSLTCCGAHVPIDLLLGDKLQKTIAFHETLGNRTLVVPGLPARLTQTNEAWVEAAHVFAGISGALRERGMRLGYHNHAAEFRLAQGQRPWDLFFGNTPKDVFIELDLGGAGYGGADPIAALRQYPGRVRLIHVKDYSPTKPDLMIGDGVMDWRSFFPVCAKIAGTEWFVIEHDSDPAAHLDDIAECLRRFTAEQTRGRR